MNEPPAATHDESTPVANLERPPTDTRQINAPIACRRCGYILKGLGSEGNCPECAAPIEYSLRENRLRFADPTWLHQITRGAAWLIAYVFITIAALIANIIASRILSPAGTEVISLGMGFLLACIWSLAVFLFTARDPAVSVPESSKLNTSKLARIGAIGALADSVIQLTFTFVNVSATPVQIIVAVLNLIVFVGLIAMFVHAHALARRIPDTRLMAQIKIVGWGLALPIALIAIFQGGIWLWAIITSWTGNQPGPTPAMAGALGIIGAVILPASCVLGVALIVFYIWAIVMLFMMRSALAEEAKVAHVMWSTPNA